MKVLLTNDDGVHAPGLDALARAVSEFATAVIVAPQLPLSGCSHQATTDRPLALEQIEPRRFAVDGTPTDCVRLALLHVAPDVDWILSGINDGANLGTDIHMSGTVAAAREATLLNRPALAFSQYRRPRQPLDWDRAASFVRQLLPRLIEQALPDGTFWNVNFPAPQPNDSQRPHPHQLPEVVYCAPDPHPLPVRFQQVGNRFHYAADYHSRRRWPGADVDVCFSGRVAVSRIALSSYQP